MVREVDLRWIHQHRYRRHKTEIFDESPLTESEEQSPQSHKLPSLLFKVRLRDNTTADAHGRADEECRKCSTYCHGGIAVGKGTADVQECGSQRTDQPYWSPTITIRNRLPEQWRKSHNCNLQRRQVRRLGDGDAKVLGDIFICGNDGCGNEVAYHGV